MAHLFRRIWGISLLVLVFTAYVQNVFFGESKIEKTEIASSVGPEFETSESCGMERNYLEKDLQLIDPSLRETRPEMGSGVPPRKCVTHIMKNFAPLTKPLSFRAQCRDEKGMALSSPVRVFGDKSFQSPCITSDYVNAVYNSLIDVADCFNIPAKELLPKLFNESGLHINSLGAGFDAGIGQLTSGALKEDVFERFNGDSKNPSGFEWYVAEMKKSSKQSCQRIVHLENLWGFEIPQGMKLCSKEEADSNPACFKVWESANRCQFISAPANPLRNVLVMAMLYRNNLKNATGVQYLAGEDYLDGRIMQVGDSYSGYFKKMQFVERFQKLGAVRANQETIKQIIMGLGFNAGLLAPRDMLNTYLTQREKSKLRLKDSDVDFVGTDISKWSAVSNPITFWKAIIADADADFDKAMQFMSALSSLGLQSKDIQGSLKALRIDTRKKFKKFEKDDAKVKVLQESVEKSRMALLKKISSKAYLLTLPEYLRIQHAFLIVDSKKVGGAPGYLSFLAKKYKDLESAMGSGVCTPENYLKF